MCAGLYTVVPAGIVTTTVYVIGSLTTTRPCGSNASASCLDTATFIERIWMMSVGLSAEGSVSRSRHSTRRSLLSCRPEATGDGAGGRVEVRVAVNTSGPTVAPGATTPICQPSCVRLPLTEVMASGGGVDPTGPPYTNQSGRVSLTTTA